MFFAVVTALLAVLAVGAAFIWHETNSCRAAQRSFLLSNALAAAVELRHGLEEQHLEDLPVQISTETQSRLRQRFADLGGDDALVSLGLVAEIMRFVPEENSPRGRMLRAGFFTTSNSLPSNYMPTAGAGQSPSLSLVWAGAPIAVSAKFEENGKAKASLKKWVAAAVPVTLGNGKMVGVMHVQQPLFGYQHLLAGQKLTSLLTAAGLFGLMPGLLIFLFIGNSIARRARHLNDGLVAQKQGRWKHRIPASGLDEIGRAMKTFNQTMEHLEKDEAKKREVIEEILNARHLAESGMETKANFLANMSHEIRTPMNGIIGTTSLLLDTNLSSEQMEFARMIRSSGDSLLHLINDILDFSKLESAKMQLEEMPVNLEEVFQETMGIFAFKAAEKGIELNQHVSEAMPRHIIGDFHRLKQVLVNLMSNAIKFTEKGEIFMMAQPVLRKHPVNGDIPCLHISVRDTGIGIPASKIQNLFHAFTQADTSTTRKYGGTGLGLAISRKLCQLMGGEISVSSEPGAGANFFFEIPLQAAPEIDGFLAEEQTLLTALRNRHVRIISTHPTTAGVVRHYCELWGMSADTPTMETGTDPETLLEGDFQLVVLDTSPQELPAAIAVANAVRSRQKAMVCIAPLGHEQIKQAIMTSAGRHASFVPKPANRRDLMKAFVAAMEARHAQPQAAVQHEKTANTAPRRTLADDYPARILLVEDQPMNQKLGRMMLAKLGYGEVDLAEDGKEAVDKVLAGNYDIVFMDLHMPVMGGEEATMEIRGNFNLQHQPFIIALTGHSLSGVKEGCREAGMNDFLTKPVSVDDIKDVIIRHLGAALAVKD